MSAYLSVVYEVRFRRFYEQQPLQFPSINVHCICTLYFKQLLSPWYTPSRKDLTWSNQRILHGLQSTAEDNIKGPSGSCVADENQEEGKICLECHTNVQHEPVVMQVVRMSRVCFAFIPFWDMNLVRQKKKDEDYHTEVTLEISGVIHSEWKCRQLQYLCGSRQLGSSHAILHVCVKCELFRSRFISFYALRQRFACASVPLLICGAQMRTRGSSTFLMWTYN